MSAAKAIHVDEGIARLGTTNELPVLRTVSLSLTLLVASCASHARPMGCPEQIRDSWSTIAWSMSDGSSGQTGCHGPVRNDSWASASAGTTRHSVATPSLDPTFPDRVPPPMLLPTDVICGGAPPSIEFQNIPFVTGTTGTLDPTRYPASGGARDPGFYVWLQGTTAGLTCPDGVTVLQPRAEGTYEVVIGGNVGDEVEIAIHDATFDLPDGRTFVIEEGIWHFVLLASQTRP